LGGAEEGIPPGAKALAFLGVGWRAKPKGLAYLGVNYQEFVVHSVENWEAEFAKTFATQETEWTITIMLD
jgi:hypothetical protein